MNILQQFFDQAQAQEAAKSNKNGTLLSQYFSSPQSTVTIPDIDGKQIAEKLGLDVAKIIAAWGEKHNIVFTGKIGTPATPDDKSSPSNLEISPQQAAAARAVFGDVLAAKILRMAKNAI